MKNPIFVMSLNIMLLSSAVAFAQTKAENKDTSYVDAQARPAKADADQSPQAQPADVDSYLDDTEIKFDNNEGKSQCPVIAKLFYEHKSALDASHVEFKDDGESDEIRIERVKRLFELLDFCHEDAREDIKDYKVTTEK